MKKYLYIVFPALIPYLSIGFVFLTLYTDFGAWLNDSGVIVPLALLTSLLLFAIFSLISGAVSCVFIVKNRVCSRDAAGLALTLKVIHIPMHLCCAILGWLLLIWMGLGLYFFAINLFAIATSGIISAYAILKSRTEGRISSISTVIRIFISFIFVIDVFFAIANYITIRQSANKTSASN